MRSVSEEMDMEDYHVQESDNEELINYISHRILSLEESFIHLCKNKSILDCNIPSNANEVKNGYLNEQNEISFCDRSYYVQEFDAKDNSGYNLNNNEANTSFNKNNYMDLIEELFREINIINETLMKVVKSNYSKNEKLKNLVNKFRNLSSKYSSLKIDMEVLKADEKKKELQVNDFESLIKNYEDEMLHLQEKNRELNEELLRRENNLGFEDKSLFFPGNNLNNGNVFDTFRNDETMNYNFYCNDQISFYEDVNKQILREKEEMKGMIDNLRSLVQKKEEGINSISLELEFQKGKVRELTEVIEKVKNEKCYLKNETDILRKEQEENAKIIEELRLKLNKRNGILKTSPGFLKKTLTIKDDHNLQLEHLAIENLHNLDSVEDEIRNLSRQMLRKQMSVRNKPSNYNISSNKGKNMNGDLNSTLIEEIDKSAEEVEVEENNKRICNKFELSYDNTYDKFDTTLLNHVIQENPNKSVDKEVEAEKTLANVLKSRSNSNNSSNNVTMIAPITMTDRPAYSRGVSRISLTASLDNIETGLRCTRSKLQSQVFLEEQSHESSGEHSPSRPFARKTESVVNLNFSSKFYQSQSQSELQNNIKNVKIYDSDLIISNTENFNISSPNKSEKKGSNNNINNIININFNTFDDKKVDMFDNSENKKLFFEFIYESLKKTKNYGKVANIVSKEEVLKNLDSKQIPFHKYYRSITNYLRNSEPNLINKFIPEDTPQERIDKYIKNYHQEIDYWKRKNKQLKLRIYRMKIQINQMKKNENIEKRKNTSSIKLKQMKTLPIIPNINISILETPLKERRATDESVNQSVDKFNRSINREKTSNEKFSDFQTIYSKINSKFEEVGKIITKIQETPKKSMTPSQSRANSRNHSFVMNSTDQFTSPVKKDKEGVNINCSSPVGFNKSSLRTIKEVCFKIHNKKSLDNFTIKNESSLIIPSLLVKSTRNSNHFPVPISKTPRKTSRDYTLSKPIPDGIKELYDKYFKYRDNLMKDSLSRRKSFGGLASAREIRTGINKKLGLNGVVKYYPDSNTKREFDHKMRLLSYLNTSLYLKSLVKKSNWIQGGN